MREAIATTDSSPSVERSDEIKISEAIASRPNGTVEARSEGIVTQYGAGEPHPPEFYTSYLSAESQTWRKSPSEPVIVHL
jgi:hypothetical protein